MPKLMKPFAGPATAALLASLICSANPAEAGRLYNSTVISVPLAPADTAIRAHTPGLDPDGGGFSTATRALGMAAGDTGLFASFGDHTVRRFNAAGQVTAQLTSEFDHDFGALAYGNDTVFVGYRTDSTSGVAFYEEDFSYKNYFEVDGAVTGLAYGADSVFVTHGSTLSRYDLSGNLLGSLVSEFGHQYGALAFGDDTLFLSYTTDSGVHGVGYYLPNLDFEGSYFESDETVRGLAFGDGRLFASYDFKLATYDSDGAQIDSTITGIAGFGVANGALAFRNAAPCHARVCDHDGPRDPGGIPEPSTWALLILGFGGVGAAIRSRRLRRLSPA